jgi:hypothetical protein
LAQFLLKALVFSGLPGNLGLQAVVSGCGVLEFTVRTERDRDAHPGQSDDDHGDEGIEGNPQRQDTRFGKGQNLLMAQLVLIDE